jgi:hypothetical protein
MQGFSIVAKKDLFEINEKHPDPYTSLTDFSVMALDAFLKAHRIGGDMAYFFETGHKNKGRAYNNLAQMIAKMPASLTFAEKQKVRLLQSADLLAWQTAKYVKDALGNTRPPRKDFLSLMEHRHDIDLLSTKKRRGPDSLRILAAKSSVL